MPELPEVETTIRGLHSKVLKRTFVDVWSDWKKTDKKGPLEEKINMFIHMLFTMDDGQMIALSDLRKFAKVELWKTEELLNSKEFLGLGPEPMEKSFTLAKFKQALKGKRGKIKQVIMVTEVIAGIGNIV